MSVVTVSHHLHIHGTSATSHVFLHKSHTLLHCKNIHSINPHSWNVVPHLVIIRMRRVAIHTRSHTIMVVLNAENHGQIPQTGHVGTLPNLSLVRRPVTVTGNGDLHGRTRLGIVMIGECQPQTYGHLRPHNTLSTVEVVRLVVKVHGSTLTLSLAIYIAEQLRENALNRPPTGQRRTMAAVRGDPRISGFEGSIDAGGHCFLSIIQMAKSSNGTRLVFVIARDLHTAHGVHQFKVGKKLFL
mmetsp:Transcript_4613/g.6947  ORF Transcript_4613/g.6947 Transcript_4613/m.6947 type:complete len:242 (-) Transcript_4613:131-856(-)